MKPEQYPEFKFQECVIAGDDCWLITPNHIATSWTAENAWMRSAIIRQSDGFCVSQGFRKFVNFGEKPAFEPWETKGPIEARHKLDGSLLIVSRYKGVTICRTRGSVDAEISMANGHELAGFKKKYTRFFDHLEQSDTSDWSYLFEWTSPQNIIILREHNEPTLTLLGAVNHGSQRFYTDQATLDSQGSYFGLDRPTKYTYNSVAECIADVKAWQGKEGVVLYSEDGETLKKIKADRYLSLHRLKGSLNLRRIGNVVDVFLQSPRSEDLAEFFSYIETLLDFETADSIRGMIEEVCAAYTRILNELSNTRALVADLAGLERRDQAKQIAKEFNGDYRKGLAFALLDGKDVIDDKLFQNAFLKHLP